MQARQPLQAQKPNNLSSSPSPGGCVHDTAAVPYLSYKLPEHELLCDRTRNRHSEQQLNLAVRVYRSVVWGGPEGECHAASAHAVKQGRQLLQALVCGEHRHSFLHHVCAHQPGHQHHALPPGDQEETLLELRLWGLHRAAPLYC